MVAGDLGADVLGRELGEAAPAATDLQHALARLQVDGLGQRCVLGRLGLGQGLIGALIEGRGVGHAGIQPALIEGVAQVVVGVDVLFRTPAVVAIEQVIQRIDRPHHDIALDQVVQAVEIQREGFQHRR
jgi:hypothetical protein